MISSPLNKSLSALLVVALVLSLAVVAVLATAPLARAQEFFDVYSSADSDPTVEGELRWVIDQVNALPAGTEAVVTFTTNTVVLSRQLQSLTHSNTSIDGEYSSGSWARIQIFGDPGFDINASDCTVRNLAFGSALSTGIGVRVRNGAGNTLEDVLVDDCADVGVLVANSNGNTLDGVDVENCGSTGVRLRNASYNSLENVVAQDCAGEGVRLRNGSYNTFDNVLVQRCADGGILVHADDPGSVSSGNTIFDCEVVYCGRNAAGPRGTSGDIYGIELLADSGAALTDNYIEDSSVYGCGNALALCGGGIGVFNASGTEIDGCLVGTSDGLTAQGNVLHGVVLGEGASDNTLGGYGRNLIIGNGGDGVLVTGEYTDDNALYMNNIGVNVLSVIPVPNAWYGVEVHGDASGTEVGWETSTYANLIGGNARGGILVDRAYQTTVSGNGIGTVRGSTTLNLGNAFNGVLVLNSEDCVIGGSEDASNSVAFNQRNGIVVREDSQGVIVGRNSIFSNGFLGIDLDPLANEPNDPATYVYPTADAPNLYMEYPFIDSAREVESGTAASGTAVPDSMVDLYYSDIEGSGYGEGQEYIKSVQTDAAGDWTLEEYRLTAGRYLTAVATDGDGNTSEFSANARISDGISPEAGILIDMGASETNSETALLLLMAADNYYSPTDLEYQLSNYADFHDVTEWTPVPNQAGVWLQAWDLEPGDDGPRTVYIRVRDPEANVGESFDDIYLKQSLPTGDVLIDGGAPVTGSPDVVLDLTLNDTYYDPSQCQMRLSNEPGFPGTLWQAYNPQVNWTLTEGSGEKTVYAQFRDPLGNTSDVYTDSIFLDQEAPVGSVLINNGAPVTDNRDVKLALDVEDNYFPPAQCQMMVSNRSDFQGAAWRPFAAQLDWKLTDGQGEKRVFVRFRDPLGNTSEAYQDTIIYQLGAGPTWYLAEGSTAWGFDAYISIQNPTDGDLNAKLTFMKTNGENVEYIAGLPAQSQVTVNPREIVGDADFSTLVECIQGKTIAVDRTMSWTGTGAASPEGHSSIGVTAPTKTWYMPEGCSAFGFETWLTVQNPNAGEATCQVTYMIEGEAPVTKTKKVPGRSRATYNMFDDIGEKSASIRITSSIPVISERAMYRNQRRSGHESIGANGGSLEYFLAEGTSAWGFTTYVVVQNPNDAQARVTVTYMTPGGPVPQEPFMMAPNSRRTIRVNDVLPNADFSTRVTGTLPIIAERAMYWDNGTGEASHDSIGMPMGHFSSFLPDGQSSGGRETWTLVQNPNNQEVEVEITYMTPTGEGNQAFTEKIPGNSRRSFSMADKLNGRASVKVESLTPGRRVIVERAMYWNSRGAGTSTIGGYVDD